MPCKTLAIILGDQLDPDYPDALGLNPSDDAILMVEVADASHRPASHTQRTVLFLSAMRHHAELLEDKSWRVEYTKLTDKDNTHNFKDELSRAIDRLKPDRVACIEPGSFDVRKQIETACEDSGLKLQIEPDPHFLCSVEAFKDWAQGRKKLTMEHFYRWQRKNHGILVEDDGEPVGGAWNYDKDNRKPFKQAPDPPEPMRFKPDEITEQVIQDVQDHLPDLPGRIDSFNWPVTRRSALRQLKNFIEHSLPSFGDYQDAMWQGEHTLYHSLLSTSLNLKLLNPREVIDAAIDAYESGDAPLNAVEGFVRQILGWREFIRGVYFQQGPDYAKRNGLNQHGSLPDFYWTGDTDMRCMHDALKSVLDLAYGHHIARLMVTGNFALIAGVNPGEVNDWYLGMYADAVEWVTTPNTVGMAMHADGGVVGTKPYAASGKYIQRMGNYCNDCPYNVKQRTGDDACPFNTFYWDFLIRNEKRFKENPRMALILKHVDKMDPLERKNIRTHADQRRQIWGIIK